MTGKHDETSRQEHCAHCGGAHSGDHASCSCAHAENRNAHSHTHCCGPVCAHGHAHENEENSDVWGGRNRLSPRVHGHAACSHGDACCAAAPVHASEPETGPILTEKGEAMPPESAVFYIESMDCPVEMNEIRAVLEKIPDVRRFGFQLSTRRLAIDADENAAEECAARIRKIGYDPVRINDGTPAETPASGRSLPKLAAALAIACAVEILHFFFGTEPAAKWSGMALSVATIWLAGFATYRKGFAAILSFRFNINALMTIAVTGAFLIGDWPEAAMVMVLYEIAELIEEKSVGHARDAVRRLFDLTPPEAEARDKDGVWTLMPVSEITPGMAVRVKPGERIPLDGRITAGAGTVNQSSVTGESIPADKRPGDPVFAGSINVTGSFEFLVTASSGDTVVAGIIRAVRKAQETGAPIQRLVDRFAAVYTPAVFVFSLCTAAFSPILFGISWLDALYKALVLLVIACPCALVIATPATVVSALAAAAKKGILIKSGAVLENVRRTKAAAFDKTGTVTEGRPKLLETEILTESFTEETVLSWAFALADSSAHPVSKAIASGLSAGRSSRISDFADMPGQGIAGTADGVRLMMCSHRLLDERGLCGEAVHKRLLAHEKKGRTVTVLTAGEDVLAVFALADTVRPHAAEAVKELKDMGILTVMLSGDNETTAEAVARETGISRVRGSLLPAEKLDVLLALQKECGSVAMAGDGINDAASLARADTGIAMGRTGTDTAMDAAGVVIMNDDLRNIPSLIKLSSDVHAVLMQNIILAMGIKLAFFALALAGFAGMWMAVFADTGACLLVLLNGLRMLKK